MKTFLVKVGMVVLLGFVALSCSTETEKSVAIDESNTVLLGFVEFKGTAFPVLSDFKTRVASDENFMYDLGTRADTDELPAEVIEVLDVLSAETFALLEANEIDLSEFKGKDDLRLAVVGLALLELDEDMISTRTSVGGCVLQAMGLDALLKKGAKKAAAKLVAKAVLKSIPYVGTAIVAVDFIWCMVD